MCHSPGLAQSNPPSRCKKNNKGVILYELVGHIWKFDLEQHKKHDFGVKGNLSKIRIGHVMLMFFAITETAIKIKSEEPIYNRWKVVKKSSGHCYSQFPDIEIYQSRAVLFETESRVITNNKEAN